MLEMLRVTRGGDVAMRGCGLCIEAQESWGIVLASPKTEWLIGSNVKEVKVNGWIWPEAEIGESTSSSSCGDI